MNLAERTQELIDRYNAEEAFGDSGDAETYANELRDLLQEWLSFYRGNYSYVKLTF